MKSDRVNYLVVGTFILMMLAAGIAAIAMLSGRTGGTDDYFTSYHDVSEIEFGTPVSFMGFHIGQVKEVEDPVFEDAKPVFRVRLGIGKKWKNLIPADSVAQVTSAGLLSAKTIDIRAGTSSTMLSPEGHIEGIGARDVFAAISNVANTIEHLTETEITPLLQNLRRYVDSFGGALESDGVPLLKDLRSLVANLSAKAPEIIENFNITARRLQEVLGPKNAAKIDLILENTAVASGNLADITGDEQIDEIISNLREASANASVLTRNANERLDDVLGEETVTKVRAALDDVSLAARNLATLSQDLRSTREKLDHFIATIDGIAVENQPDIRGSIKDLRHTMESISRRVDAITHNLESTSRNMNEFSRELRQNPGLLLGGKPPSDTAAP